MGNLVMGFVAGLKCGAAMRNGQYAVCLSEVFQGMMVPLLYQGLLQVTVFVSDPLGEDIIDFPIVEYQLEMSESCLSQLGTRRLHKLRVKEGQSPLPNAQIMHSLSDQKDASLPALSPTPATGPAVP